MDRTSGDEVGGPYATQQDAERAVERNSLGKPSAELKIIEEPHEEGPEDDDGGVQRTSVRESFQRTSNQFGDEENAPSDGLDPQDPPFSGHEQPAPAQEVPQTTKPSQLPEGSSAMQPGGMQGLPIGLTMDTALPSSPQFDPGSLSTDPVGTRVNAVASLVQRQNPDMDEETVRRVARKVTGMLVTADWGWHPEEQHIEDPLHHTSPLPRFLRDPGDRRAPGSKEEPQVAPHDLRIHDLMRGTHDIAGMPREHPRAQQQPEPEDPDQDWNRRMREEEPQRHAEEPVDLSEFDRSTSLPLHPRQWGSGRPSAEWERLWQRMHEPEEPSIHRGSLHTADWGWEPMEQTTELPDAKPKGEKKDDGGDDGGGSSLPKMPKMPGMGGGAGEGAAGGEAAGGAAVAEDLPLLLL